jgi:hypothetical protein
MPKLKYIDSSFYEDLFGVDLLASDQFNDFERAAVNSSEIINALTGDKIESVGFNNLSDKQQGSVKKATAFQIQHFLQTGNINMQAGSASFSGGGLAFSYTNPLGAIKKAYIHEMVYSLLAQAGLYSTVLAFDPSETKQTEPKRKHIYER